MQTLLDYHYPGNIRELSNIVEYAVNICKRKKINRDHLPSYLFENRLQDSKEPDAEPKTEAFSSARGLPGREAATRDSDHDANWNDIERRMIVDTLKKHGGKQDRDICRSWLGTYEVMEKNERIRPVGINGGSCGEITDTRAR